MERSLTIKGMRWIIIALTLLIVSTALLVTLVPSTNAKYVGNAVEIDTGINGLSEAHVNELLLMMLDERYPIGSIYMTTTGACPPVGGWAILKDSDGRVPVGVWESAGGDVLHETAARRTGGNPNGSSSDIVVSTNGSIDVKGNIGLTPGDVEVSGGSVQIGGTVTLNGSESFTTDNLTIEEKNLPSHTHTATLNALPTSYPNPSGNGTFLGFVSSEYGSPSAYTVALSAFTNRTSPAGAYVYPNKTSGGTTFDKTPFKVTKNFVLADNFTAALVNDGSGNPLRADLTNHVITYTDQAIDANAASLQVNGSNTLAIGDNTVQPYDTCYFYQRIS